LTSAFYTALQEGGQVELPRHTDGGDISFMIALSGSNDYEGERERERENTLIGGGAMIALSGSNDYEGAHILKSTRPLRFSEFKGLG
jgi:hypothetical protein